MEILGEADLDERVANQLFSMLGWPQVGTDKEPVRIDALADRTLLLTGARGAIEDRTRALREQLIAQLNRQDLPDWAAGEFAKRVEADGDIIALRRFEALLQLAVDDPSLHLTWSED